MLQQNKDTYKVFTLREFREKLGLSQEAVARQLQISRNAYCAIENGKSEPKLKHFYALSVTLGVPVKSLMASFGYDVSLIPDD